MEKEIIGSNWKRSLVGYGMAMETQKPYIAMIFIQFVYAGMALFSKVAISKGMSPFVFVFYRQAFAALALCPFAFFFERGKSPPLSFTLLCKIFFISLIGITLSLNLFYVAINYTTATFAAATPSTIPAITFLLAALLRIESIQMGKLHGVTKVVGSAISVSGALVFAFVKGPELKFLINSNWYNHSTSHSHLQTYSKGCIIKGSLLMLSANTAWSLWLILQGVVVKEYPAKLRLTALQCMFSCIQSAIFAISIDTNSSSWKLGWDFHLLSVAYCGIVVTGITYWMQVWAIEKKGPVFTASFTPLALIITALFSTFIWKQPLFCGSVVGTILLGGGLYGVLWAKNKEQHITNSETHKLTQDITNPQVIIHCITHH